METGSGSGPDDLTHFRQLVEDPTRYHLFHALRVIEARYRDAPRLGESRTAAQDRVRLGQVPELAFPAATLTAFHPGEAGRPARLSNLFFGLWGPHGPLPLHLTEYARDRLRNHRDPTLVAFADMLTHRVMSLFYRVWAAAQPAAALDRAWVSFEEEAEAFARDFAYAAEAGALEEALGLGGAEADAYSASGGEAGTSARPGSAAEAGSEGAIPEAGAGGAYLPEDALSDWDLSLSAGAPQAGRGGDGPDRNSPFQTNGSSGDTRPSQSPADRLTPGGHDPFGSGAMPGAHGGAAPTLPGAENPADQAAATRTAGAGHGAPAFQSTGRFRAPHWSAPTGADSGREGSLGPLTVPEAGEASGNTLSPGPHTAAQAPSSTASQNVDDDFERTVILPRGRAAAQASGSAATRAPGAGVSEAAAGSPSGQGVSPKTDRRPTAEGDAAPADASALGAEDRPATGSDGVIGGQPNSAAVDEGHAGDGDGAFAGAGKSSDPFAASQALGAGSFDQGISDLGALEIKREAGANSAPPSSLDASEAALARDEDPFTAGVSAATPSGAGVGGSPASSGTSAADDRPEEERTVIPFPRRPVPQPPSAARAVDPFALAPGVGQPQSTASGQGQVAGHDPFAGATFNAVGAEGAEGAGEDKSAPESAGGSGTHVTQPALDHAEGRTALDAMGASPGEAQHGAAPLTGRPDQGAGGSAAGSGLPRSRSPFGAAAAGRLAERGLADPTLYAPIEPEELERLGLGGEAPKSEPSDKPFDIAAAFDALLEPLDDPAGSGAAEAAPAQAVPKGTEGGQRPHSFTFRLLPRPRRPGKLDLRQDVLQRKVAALSGYADAAMLGADAMPDLSKRFFAGLMSSGPKNADGLRAILEHFFEAKFTIQQFVGQWLTLEKDDTWQLGKTALGRGTSVGRKVWSRDSKFRLQIGPLDLADYQRLLPGRGAIERMEAIVRNYVGDRLAWDVQLILKADQVPKAILGQNVGLGYNSWMGSRIATQKDADDLILTPPSQTAVARALAGH